MARTVRDTNLQSREARLRLGVQSKPYWRLLEAGLHIGYRRVKDGGGTWVARRFVGDGKYKETKIGTADDLQDADGVAIMSFSDAQAAARDWWRGEQRKDAGHAPDGPYTVAQALEDYFVERERRGSKGLRKDRAAAHLRILPALGDIEVSKLTTRRLREWQAGLVKAPKLTKAGRFWNERIANPVDMSDADAVRARKATSNRTLAILKAALNFAYSESYVASDDAWRKLKPLPGTVKPVIRYLSDDEARRLVNACDGAFRDIVRGALVSGCRYGELTRMRVHDFNADARTITVRESKSGKSRHVFLTDEGAALFGQLTAGKSGRDLIFAHSDGRPWGPSHQQYPLDVASKRAKIEPAATFHILRHSYASSLAMRGVQMPVIGAQLGHAPGSPITARHYAHLAPSYVADTIRAALPALGIVEETNVTPLRNRAARD
jgi:integrase